MMKGKFNIHESSDGSIDIEYCDLNVEIFDRDDYEVHYNIDKDNVDKLKNILEKSYKGDLKMMMIEAFGECLDKCSLAEWLDNNEVKYKLFIV